MQRPPVKSKTEISNLLTTKSQCTYRGPSAVAGIPCDPLNPQKQFATDKVDHNCTKRRCQGISAHGDHELEKDCLLEAVVFETQLCETIKLEKQKIKWQLLTSAQIDRKLFHDARQPCKIGEPGKEQLRPHNLQSMRINFIKKKAKLRLTEQVTDNESGQGLSVVWVAQFSSAQKAQVWRNAIEMVSSSVGKMNAPVICNAQSGGNKVKSLGSPRSCSKNLLHMPVIMTQERRISRRNAILRGTMEKNQPRHLRGLIFCGWKPVTWIVYNDGLLEEYSRSKASRDLLSTFRISEFDIKVPMTVAEEELGGPNFTVPQDDIIVLKNRQNSRAYKYRAPNKLMQIQWLGTLIGLQGIPQPQVNAQPGTSHKSSDESVCCSDQKFRLPRKLSVMQEKCLVDILGLVITLWTNVVWEYSDNRIIRRRYEDPRGNTVKAITRVEDLTITADSVITQPESRKKKAMQKLTTPIYASNGQWVLPTKSKRQFIISSSSDENSEDIYVRAENQQLRDEWYSILLRLQQQASKAAANKDDNACVVKNVPLSESAENQNQLAANHHDESSKIPLTYNLRETKPEEQTAQHKSPAKVSAYSVDVPVKPERTPPLYWAERTMKTPDSMRDTLAINIEKESSTSFALKDLEQNLMSRRRVFDRGEGIFIAVPHVAE